MHYMYHQSSLISFLHSSLFTCKWYDSHFPLTTLSSTCLMSYAFNCVPSLLWYIYCYKYQGFIFWVLNGNSFSEIYLAYFKKHIYSTVSLITSIYFFFVWMFLSENTLWLHGKGSWDSNKICPKFIVSFEMVQFY